jgi:hypothetical protein
MGSEKKGREGKEKEGEGRFVSGVFWREVGS